METKPTAAPKKPVPVVTTSKPSTRRKNRPRRPTVVQQKPSSTTARYEEYTTSRGRTSTTTTPAPPTTPDSGTDFKCEDEGFFPHPRDCKKYFWCLDSGPSELGIVAHQFTCPSGLVFNKLADSCDYTRNVQCSKPKTTATTTTAKSSTSTARTTTRSPPRITSATTPAPKRTIASIRPLLRTTTPTTTTTTTTEAYEEYEDEEYADEGTAAEDPIDVALDSEDPKVIKELIDLIKKVGGIEELEKQLKQNQDGSHVLHDSSQSSITTTPASIHQKLYEKILRKPIPGIAAAAAKPKDRQTNRPTATTEATSSSNQLPKYSSIYRATSNSRPGPQNAGLDQFAETQGLRNDKPQYVTITRNRPQQTPAEAVEEVVEEDEEEEEGDASSEDFSIARSTEATFVRYTIPEHVEVTGHDETYRLSSFFDGQDEAPQSSSTPYVTIQRATTPKSQSTTSM